MTFMIIQIAARDCRPSLGLNCRSHYYKDMLTAGAGKLGFAAVSALKIGPADIKTVYI